MCLFLPLENAAKAVFRKGWVNGFNTNIEIKSFSSRLSFSFYANPFHILAEAFIRKCFVSALHTPFAIKSPECVGAIFVRRGCFGVDNKVASNEL